MGKITKKDALRYHAEGKPGKIEVIPHQTIVHRQIYHWPILWLNLGLEIEKNPLDAYNILPKGNLVAVISNGTAVLGLGI